MSVTLPNIIIEQRQAIGIEQNRSLPVTNPPILNTPKNFDAGYIEIIKNQQLPNEIEKLTQSKFKNDIEQMVKLLNYYCSIQALDKIQELVKEIHETLNQKENPEIKQWIRVLTNIHPKIDKYENENLDYWKNLHSEIVGTNTILYYADTTSIDLTFWSNAPMNSAKSNIIEWTLAPWTSPTYLRETVRHKLDQPVVEYIQNAGHTTSVMFRRNIIFDAFNTTKPETGGNIAQERPIPDKAPHGASLASDTYHQIYRITNNNQLNKYWNKQDVIYKLDESGYFVHVLINHLEPLINQYKAVDFTYEYKAPLGIETDTFPRKDKQLVLKVNQNGEPVYDKPTELNDKCLEPEIVDFDDES